MSPILRDSELINCSLSLATEGDRWFNIGCELSIDCLFNEGNGEVSVSKQGQLGGINFGALPMDRTNLHDDRF